MLMKDLIPVLYISSVVQFTTNFHTIQAIPVQHLFIKKKNTHDGIWSKLMFLYLKSFNPFFVARSFQFETLRIALIFRMVCALKTL